MSLIAEKGKRRDHTNIFFPLGGCGKRSTKSKVGVGKSKKTNASARD